MLSNALKPLFRQLFQLLFRFYRTALSPALHLFFGPGNGCRFEPSCSVYAEEAVRELGPYKGGWLAIRRLCRCHPFSRSGYDPVRAIPRSTFK